MTAENLLKIGGFYPYLVPHYLSDYEFSMRAHSMGFNIITHPNVKVYTNEIPTGITEPSYESLWKFLKTYLSPRNYRQPFYVFNFILLACPSYILKKKHIKNLLIEIKGHLCKALKKYTVLRSTFYFCVALLQFHWLRQLYYFCKSRVKTLVIFIAIGLCFYFNILQLNIGLK
jgi:GT2 family glycosyltransferase